VHPHLVTIDSILGCTGPSNWISITCAIQKRESLAFSLRSVVLTGTSHDYAQPQEAKTLEYITINLSAVLQLSSRTPWRIVFEMLRARFPNRGPNILSGFVGLLSHFGKICDKT